MKILKRTFIISLVFITIFIVSLIIGCNNADHADFIIDERFFQTGHAGIPEDQICRYADCENPADCSITYRNFDKGTTRKDQLLKIENKADFSVSTNSFVYTPVEKRTGRDTGVYLVPQADGSLKIENRTYKYEYEYKGPTENIEYVEFKGYFCNEHAVDAKYILKEEIKAAYGDSNKFFKYIVPIASAACFVITIIICIIQCKKTGEMTDDEKNHGQTN